MKQQIKYVEHGSDQHLRMIENGWKELHTLIADGKRWAKLEKEGVYGKDRTAN
jgi:hypothetical protein